MVEFSSRLPFAWLDALDAAAARTALARCCASGRWVEAMLARRPFGSKEALHDAARAAWSALERADFLEAFAGHPAIGARLATLQQNLRPSAGWSAEEQAGVENAAPHTLAELERANRTYLERFGYLFIVCATGKSANEMLALLTARLANDPATELLVAAAEQAKITEIRLEKLGS
jgi:2-oxo-4-hydroxy-4-carboxy-5-ureidoimidazoline decarboxylase